MTERPTGGQKRVLKSSCIFNLAKSAPLPPLFSALSLAIPNGEFEKRGRGLFGLCAVCRQLFMRAREQPAGRWLPGTVYTEKGEWAVKGDDSGPRALAGMLSQNNQISLLTETSTLALLFFCPPSFR